MKRTLTVLAVLAIGSLGLAPAPTSSDEALPVDPPVLGSEVPRGTWTTEPASPQQPTGRTVDGEIDDWIGERSGYAGTVVHSAGELIYTDHLFDAYGADDGTDTERRERLGEVEGAVPEAYRLEATINANLPGQVGVPPPPVVGTDEHYGDLDFDATTDLVELRLAADADALWVLARTSQLHATDQTALLLLLDTDGQERAAVEVPFDAGITTQRANFAVLLVGDRGHLADLDADTVTPLPQGSVATNPEKFTNAIEAALPLELLGGELEAATAATGAFDAEAGDDTGGFADTGLGANLANVAFRTAEPVREWFDERQALALHAGSIDDFLHEVDLDHLRGGRTEGFVPGPGYHERVFASTTEGLAEERGREGLFQHYGLYLPTAITEARAAGELLPLQLWLHWRGGNAHSAGALTPGVFRHFGEDRDGIVVSPRGRGTSTWYVSRGHADVLEVLDDVEATHPTDPDRVYLSGHSMGGYGSYLFAILYPDRFAATLPVAGPVTQGAWTGVDFDGCDEFAYDEYTPCYIEANDSDPRAQHTRRMLDNLRNTPIGMFYAAADELVPIAGAVRQHERLLELGYRHRFFSFPAHEHFTHPVVDEWAAGVAYLDQFVRDENPHEVTYLRDGAFEDAVNTIRAGGIDFDWRFDSAYWMSELGLADGAEVARFDGRSLAIAEPDPLVMPDTDAPTGVNQTGPYTVTGLQWIDDPLAADVEQANAFEVELAGATRVRLDLARMGLDTSEVATGEVATEHPLELQLTGTWDVAVAVEVDGEEVDAHLASDDLLVVSVPAGERTVTITPQTADDPDGLPGRSGDAPGRGGDGPPGHGVGGPPGPGTIEYQTGRGR
jgi:pimeloyl-ACP methyl ester carboxylesterase